MEEVTVKLGPRSYPIYIDHDWIGRLGQLLRGLISFNRVLIISDNTVARLYGDMVSDSLSQAEFLPEVLVIPEGEQHKDFNTMRRIYDFLIEYNYPRQSTLLALGGGMVGDITGFAAATYMRGVNFVQVPTTLLGMVDSSVGGKVGINHPLAKNMIGAFYQPRLVFIDLACLKTLPVQELRAGFAEVIKYGVIKDAEFFEFLEERVTHFFALDKDCLARVVKTSCEIKAWVVEQDEREANLRAILNFGHTIGHALESLTNYIVYRHGEAIAIGMLAGAQVAQKMGMIGSIQVQRLWALIKKARLPYKIPTQLEPEDILERIKKDKKVVGEKIRYVLPTQIGEVMLKENVSESLIKETLEEMREK